jgi:abortive infection bacteriophage resistance protein
MNREAGLNLFFHAATEAIQQWVRDIKEMRIMKNHHRHLENEHIRT